MVASNWLVRLLVLACLCVALGSALAGCRSTGCSSGGCSSGGCCGK